MLPPPIESRFFTNTDDFIAAFEQMSFQSEAILLKGARRFAFERIALRLEKKVHRTVLEVDLNALIHNLRIFQARLEAETKIMAMVKAAAYGSGSLEVARLLAYQGADYLAVAYADEGVELRRGGVQLPIMVLNPEKSAFDLMIRYNLEPELYNFRILREWLTLLLNEERLPGVHLKVDTGMHRLGFEAADLPELVSLLKENPSLKVRSIFTHLAASEASEHDDFTRRQINVFSTVYQQLAEALGYRPLRHVLNSGGIVRFPQYQFDMVRLGIGLYGVDASASLQERLRRVLRLRASISQIKTVAAGETIGYGRRGVVEKSMRMATVSIGYADGLPRSAGNGRYQLNVGGQLAPTVGSICMDMCMVDISRIPEAREGDAVEVFGDLPTAQDLAACENTIPYEVFTRISPRVKRIYIQE
jgi:alanine racemase